MSSFGETKTATLSPANATATAPTPARRRPGKAVFGALLLGLIGAVGFNVYVFANAPRSTPSFGLADVQQIYSQAQTLDEQRPARLD
jgi:hypothetical protein